MKKLETNIKFTLTNRHRQNAVVEKANKRLGTLILKFQAENELIKKKLGINIYQNLLIF